MNEHELLVYFENKYKFTFPKGYIHFALTFNELDKNAKNLQTHHICPRCCGGGDEEQNLVKVTFHHHRKLHQLVLQTVGLSDEQRNKLKFAYKSMQGH